MFVRNGIGTYFGNGKIKDRQDSFEGIHLKRVCF